MNFSDSASVLERAPDESSAKSARELANSDKGWIRLGAFDSDEGEVVWSEFQGSSKEPYRTRVGVDDATFRCSCPSRKQPCKHALALLLKRLENPREFVASPPAWVENDEKPTPTYANSRGGRDEPSPFVPLELPESWQSVLGDELEKPYFQQLSEFLREERASHVVYPPGGEEFNALKATPYDRVKVLILGQDPYHGPNQAHGMAFSVRPGVRIPPSLENIFAELQSDLGIARPRDGFLQNWAEQGVLLLNTVLTVRRSEAFSHKGKGWEKFTDAVIKAVAAKDERVVFVFWGSPAQKKEKFVDTTQHTVVKSVHPSPLSAHKGFFGSKPFSQINAALEEAGREPINWNLLP